MSDLREEKIHTIRYAEGQARLGGTVFLIFGVLGALVSAPNLTSAVPLLIFYGTLVVNTYFSIRCFGAITRPGDRSQKIADGILVVLYLLLALSFANALIFVALAILLFKVSTIKYILLSTTVEFPSHKRLLRRKIYINATGTLLCVFALGGIFLGYGMVALWSWTLVFVIANIYLLIVNPLYVLND